MFPEQEVIEYVIMPRAVPEEESLYETLVEVGDSPDMTKEMVEPWATNVPVSPPPGEPVATTGGH